MQCEVLNFKKNRVLQDKVTCRCEQLQQMQNDLPTSENLHCTQLTGTGLREFSSLYQSELPPPADHGKFVHQQNGWRNLWRDVDGVFPLKAKLPQVARQQRIEGSTCASLPPEDSGESCTFPTSVIRCTSRYSPGVLHPSVCSFSSKRRLIFTG